MAPSEGVYIAGFTSTRRSALEIGSRAQVILVVPVGSHFLKVVSSVPS